MDGVNELSALADRLIFLAGAAALMGLCRLKLGEGVALICRLGAISMMAGLLSRLLPG